MNTAPLARRIERVTLAPRYDVRVRESRIRPVSAGMALYRFGWASRGRKIVAPAAAPAAVRNGGDTRKKPDRAEARRTSP
jgi:hypothetical protein